LPISIENLCILEQLLSDLQPVFTRLSTERLQRTNAGAVLRILCHRKSIYNQLGPLREQAQNWPVQKLRDTLEEAIRRERARLRGVARAKDPSKDTLDARDFNVLGTLLAPDAEQSSPPEGGSGQPEKNS
jgi:hypothetical protein